MKYEIQSVTERMIVQAVMIMPGIRAESLQVHAGITTTKYFTRLMRTLVLAKQVIYRDGGFYPVVSVEDVRAGWMDAKEELLGHDDSLVLPDRSDPACLEDGE